MPECKYIVHPRNDHSNQMIAAALAQAGKGTGEEVEFVYKGKKKPGGYYVEHAFIVRLKACAPDTRIKIDYYEKRGGGAVEKYGIPKNKPSKELKKAKEYAKKAIAAKK